MAESNEPNYLECPLVQWVDTFRNPSSPKLQYTDLYNGTYLADVMYKIDPRPAYQGVVRTVQDINIRLQNWDMLLKNIRAYYSDVLQQLLIIKLPNVQLICREPEKESGFTELKKALLLILGCAVQCEYKKNFIEVIRGLEISVQTDIVQCIQQITDDSKCILPKDCTDVEKVIGHLVNVIKERDEYEDMMMELVQERDFYHAKAEGQALSSTPSESPDKQAMAAELTECKAKLRTQKQELDERFEQLSDLRDECEEYRASLTKLRNENVDLLKDARAARALRDELDIMNEKMSKMNNYESEILKYKERLNELEFYKTRVNELREDNEICVENIAMLKEQLSNANTRIENVVKLEKDVLKYRKEIAEISAERDADCERIRSLVEENAELQLHKKMSMNESSSLEEEMQAAKAKIAGMSGAIGDQLKDTTNAKVLRLELENQKLLRKIEDMHQSALIENTTLNLELKNENQRLAKKIEKLQQEKQEISVKCFDFEEKNRAFAQDKEEVVKALKYSKECAEKQIKEMEQQNADIESEKMSLQETLHSSKLSNRKITEQNAELEKECLKYQEEISQLRKENKKNTWNLKAADSAYKKEREEKELHLESENTRLRRQLESVTSRAHKVEKDSNQLEEENYSLQESLKSTKLSQKKISEQNNELERECQKYQEEISELRKENKKNTWDLKAADSALNELRNNYAQLESYHKELKKTSSVYNEKGEMVLVQTLQEEKKTVALLRCELVNEKIKTEKLEKELAKLHLDLEKVGIQIGQPLNKSLDGNDSHVEALESWLNDSVNQSLSMKGEKIQALESRLDESMNRNLKLQEELRITRRECESLKQRMEEESHGKERERQESVLVRKSPFMKTGGYMSPDQKSAHNHNVALERDNASLKTQNNSLNEQIKKLESHTKSLQGENTTLRTQVSVAQKDQKEYLALKRLHEQTTSEYEALISEHGSLKSTYKNLQHQLDTLLHDKNDASKIRDWVMREHEQLEKERKSMGNMQVNYNKLRDEHNRVLNDYNKLKDTHTGMERDFNNLQQDYTEEKEKLNMIESELNTLAVKHDTLYETYQKTLEEKEQLMEQVQLLIRNNQELLRNVLNNKDQMVGQELSYKDQLSNLRRQKERLEEKIMEHYKNREKQKKNKSFGAMLLQKVRGLKKSNKYNGDNSSLGSGGSFAEPGEFSKKSDKRRYKGRRGSDAGGLWDTDSPKLSKQNRGLAKSTTALYKSTSMESHSFSSSDLRGARSTEDLLSDTLRSHGDNVSFSNSSFMLLPGMGRPVSDDEGGFKSNDRVSSPVDYLTLEEFLAEGTEGKTSLKPQRKIEMKYTESSSSENSDGGVRRRRRAPLPPNQNGGASVPDVAMVIPSEPGMSRMSQVSTSSSGLSQQDVRPESSAFTQVASPPYHMQPNNTSTPAKLSDSYKPSHIEDINNTSAFSQVGGLDESRNNSGYDHHRDHPSQHMKHDVADSPHYRGNRPTMADRDNKLTPNARLDNMLTRTGGGSTFSLTSPNGAESPHSNFSSPNDPRSMSHDSDMSVRSGPSSGRRGQSVKDMHFNFPQNGPSPARTPQQQQQQQYDDRNPISPSSTPQRKGNILVSRQGPRPYGGAPRSAGMARPASAFGAPMKSDHSLGSGINNARPNPNNSMSNKSLSDVRSSYNDVHNNGPTSAFSNGPVHNPRVNQRYNPNRAERPKSVPPTMFNQQGSSDSDSSFNNEYQLNNSVNNKRTPPLPPPRKNKDVLTSGRYSVIREPTSPTKPMPSSGNPVQRNSSGYSGSSGPIRASHPQNFDTKQENKSPAPKPMNTGEGEQKANPLWRPKKVTFDIDGLPESPIL